MIRTFFCLSSLLILGLLTTNCYATPKLAIVDSEVVYTQSTLIQNGKDYLQSLSSKFEVELAELQKKVDTGSEEEKKAAQEELQKKLGEVQKQFNEAQQNVAEIITEAFNRAVEACRAKNGYDMILVKNAVLASGANLDVTAKALEELNSMASSVDFAFPGGRLPQK